MIALSTISIFITYAVKKRKALNKHKKLDYHTSIRLKKQR